MIPHTVITVVWMLVATPVLGPWAFAPVVAWWWSREQYLQELALRKSGRTGPRAVLWSIVSVWNPTTYKNMDLIVPAVVALVLSVVLTRI